MQDADACDMGDAVGNTAYIGMVEIEFIGMVFALGESEACPVVHGFGNPVFGDIDKSAGCVAKI